MELSPDLTQRPSSAGGQSSSSAINEETGATSRPPPPSTSSPTSAAFASLTTAPLVPSPPPTPAPSTSTTTPPPPTDEESNTRNDLRSMSQRLERLLRQRRELMERLGNEIQSEVNNIRDGRSNNETGAYYPGPLDSSSQSEEEEEEGAAARRRRDRSPGVNSDGFQRRSSSRIPIRRGGAFGGWMEDSWDYLSDSVLRNRRISNSVGAAGGDSWRPLTIRERLDIRAGLRRESERERARLARERDMSLRRMRYGELGTPGADRVPSSPYLIRRSDISR